MNYVIIGNSASGIAAVEAIRECDKKGKITVISDEPHFNYSRPLISYLLGRKIDSGNLAYRTKEFYRDKTVDLFLNKKAKRLDVRKKEVVLEPKQKIRFDKLLIATGGIPVVPKIEDSGSGGVFTFTKLADVELIEKYIKRNRVKSAVVIGGGLIGLKATEALLELKIKVTIVELADKILSATFDRKASGIIEGALERKGCGLIVQNTVVQIEGLSTAKSQVTGVILKDKRKIRCDMVIIAIGVRPNIELVKETPIKTNKGILVDNFMQTNIKHIYAAGDCCQAEDLLSNIKQIIAIWPLAVRQGGIAGYNMAGTKKEYSGGFTMNSVELCGIPTISAGKTLVEKDGYQVLDYYNKEKSKYKKVVLREGKIVGTIFVGDIERAGIYTGLIKDKVDVSSFKEQLLKEDFGLVSLPKDYRKHLITAEAVII